MPFALLLQTTIKPLTDAAELLAPWERLAFLEMRMLERARSAFLVRWFGSETPITGLSVSVAIANGAELEERFGLVKTANRANALKSPQGVDGPGLLEPLSGLAGGLAGALFSPSGSIMLGVVVALVQRTVFWTVVAVLNAFTLGLLPTAAAFIVLIPATALAFGTLSPGPLRLLAAAGPLLIAVRRFWDQLTGPRERVANPVVAAALRAADALAGLLPLLLAAFATAVTRVGPELESLAIQFIRLADLSRTMLALLGFIGADLSRRLIDTLTPGRGIDAAVGGVFSALSASFAHTGGWLLDTWNNLVDIMVASKAVVDAAVSGWWLTAQPQIRALTIDNPLIGAMKKFADELGIVADAWKHSARPSKPSPPGPLGVALAMLLSKPGPTFPTFPTITAFPVKGSPAGAISTAARTMIAVDALLPGVIPSPMVLDEASWAALAAARRPAGVFAGRAAELRRSLKPERAQREQALSDLEAYTRIAQRLASPAVGPYLAQLDSTLVELQERIKGERGLRRLPVRDLDDPVLRPRIGTLRIRVPGGDRATVDAWTRLLRGRLQARPASTPAGG